MASIHSNGPTRHPQLPRWSTLEHSGSGTTFNTDRTPMVHPEPLRPIEPGASQSRRPSYLPPQLHERNQGPQTQQLPGVQELLSPSIRPDARKSVSTTWAPINNPPIWQDRFGDSLHGRGAMNTPMPPVHQPPYHHRAEIPPSENFRQPMQPSTNNQIQPALTRPPRQQEVSTPAGYVPRDPSLRGAEYFSSPSCHTMPMMRPTDAALENMFERRASSALPSKSGSTISLLNQQIVGQRDIPGEGLCYVFKDGSTCPTVIDGEAVNPLWGTTKAGKARKRLAQACLNCREKKIKCEPGDVSCLQCEKAKRECLRPSAAQTQAEMATVTTLSISNGSPGRGDWTGGQISPKSISMTEFPPLPKRRRSAHIAQQESTCVQSQPDCESPRSGPKRRKSDQSSCFNSKQSIERLRKDSKRIVMEDGSSSSAPSMVDRSDILDICEDPYRLEPDGTMLFLDLFFSQSARETRLLFPRHAFTRWVRTCNIKCQRECMVLFAVLAVGSLFSKGDYSSFARMCLERASQAAASQYGRFSVALVQARLLLATHSQSKGKDELAWDYNGSALRAVGAMRLNTEEGCGEALDEYRRPYYSFTQEQLRECRRRTFWTVFLMDRYTGFCSGLLNTINEDDVHVRLPCIEKAYEDGLPSIAPCFEAGLVLSGTQHPASYTIMISTVWREVTQSSHRSIRHHPSAYPARYESFFNNTQRRLSEWNTGLPQHLKYSRENLERAVYHDYAGDFVSMQVLYLFANLKAARMVRHELLSAQAVARSICMAHSQALQLLALVRDIRVLTLLASPNSKHRTTDLMSPFIAYAITSAIDTLGAGGLREEIVATRQVLSTSIEVLQELSQHCHNARSQCKMAERRLARIESCSPELDVRAGRGADGRCWRITEPMEKVFSLQQDVMYGISSLSFAEALAEGRR